jgi:hypothetical protein
LVTITPNQITNKQTNKQINQLKVLPPGRYLLKSKIKSNQSNQTKTLLFQNQLESITAGASSGQVHGPVFVGL